MNRWPCSLAWRAGALVSGNRQGGATLVQETWGIFTHRKWRTALRVSFPQPGGSVVSFAWSSAILDTGSPVHILPGRAPSHADVGSIRSLGMVEVSIYHPSQSECVGLCLPSSGLFPIPIGGVEGLPMFRFEFWARMQADGVPNIGDTPFIVMDTPFPILSVGQLVEHGGRFTFERGRFTVR